MEIERIAELVNEFMYEYDEYEYEDCDTDYNTVLEELQTRPESVADYLEEIDNEEYIENALRLAKIIRKNLV